MDFYKELRLVGPITSAAFSKRTGCHPRWLHEWLLQNAAAGILSFDAKTKEFRLNPGYGDLLIDGALEGYSDKDLSKVDHSMVGMFQGGPEIVSRIFKLDQCFETKEGEENGASYDEGEYSIDLNQSLHRMHNILFKRIISQKVLDHPRIALSQALGRLKACPGTSQAGSGFLVADFGCGVGQNVREMAKFFPSCSFHGYDISEKAIEMAKRQATLEKLKNVMFFNPLDPSDQASTKDMKYDLIICYDVVHDTAKPVEFLSAVKEKLKQKTAGQGKDVPSAEGGGVFICIDFKADKEDSKNVNKPFSAMSYGYSLGLCLQSSMSEKESMGLGTYGLSPERFEKLAEQAGFKEVELLTVPELPSNNIFIVK